VRERGGRASGRHRRSGCGSSESNRDQTRAIETRYRTPGQRGILDRGLQKNSTHTLSVLRRQGFKNCPKFSSQTSVSADLILRLNKSHDFAVPHSPIHIPTRWVTTGAERLGNQRASPGEAGTNIGAHKSSWWTKASER